MKTRKVLLQIDHFFQMLLFYGTITMAVVAIMSKGFFVTFLMLALLGLGAWQLLSGLIMGGIFGDEKRITYLVGSIAYLIVLFFGSEIVPYSNTGSIVLSIIFVGIIPMIIAFWYLNYTENHLKKLTGEFEKILTKDVFDDILDSGKIARNNKNASYGKADSIS